MPSDRVNPWSSTVRTQAGSARPAASASAPSPAAARATCSDSAMRLPRRGASPSPPAGSQGLLCRCAQRLSAAAGPEQEAQLLLLKDDRIETHVLGRYKPASGPRGRLTQAACNTDAMCLESPSYRRIWAVHASHERRKLPITGARRLRARRACLPAMLAAPGAAAGHIKVGPHPPRRRAC